MICMCALIRANSFLRTCSTGLWEMTTSMIQHKLASQRLTPHNGEIPFITEVGETQPSSRLRRGLRGLSTRLRRRGLPASCQLFLRLAVSCAK